MSMSNYRFAIRVTQAMKKIPIVGILSPESLFPVQFFKCLCQISLIWNYFLRTEKFDILSVDCTVGKGEIACYHSFISTMFSKVLYCRRVWERVIKKILLNIFDLHYLYFHLVKWTECKPRK